MKLKWRRDRGASVVPATSWGVWDLFLPYYASKTYLFGSMDQVWCSFVAIVEGDEIEKVIGRHSCNPPMENPHGTE